MIFLRFKAQEFCGRILRQHDEESEQFHGRGTVSFRGKIHWPFLQKSTCARIPSFMQPSPTLNVFIKYTGLLQ